MAFFFGSPRDQEPQDEGEFGYGRTNFERARDAEAWDFEISEEQLRKLAEMTETPLAKQRAYLKKMKEELFSCITFDRLFIYQIVGPEKMLDLDSLLFQEAEYAALESGVGLRSSDFSRIHKRLLVLSCSTISAYFENPYDLEDMDESPFYGPQAEIEAWLKTIPREKYPLEPRPSS